MNLLHRRHRIGVRSGMLQVVLWLIAVKEGVQSLEIGGLATTFLRCPICLNQLSSSRLDIRGCRGCQHLMKVRHRLAPIGNGAIRIGRLDVLKGEGSLIVPERVQERDTAIEFGSRPERS